MQVPSFFSDENDLWFLAKVVVDPSEIKEVGGKRKLVIEEDFVGEEDEVCIITKEEAVIKTLRKRRAKKMRAPLSKEFVRRSHRLNKDLQGFRDQESGDASNSIVVAVVLVLPVKEAALKDMEQQPLEFVPPQSYIGLAANHTSTSAPFLNVENVQAMATGFLKMQAGSVSASVLLESSDEE